MSLLCWSSGFVLSSYNTVPLKTERMEAWKSVWGEVMTERHRQLVQLLTCPDVSARDIFSCRTPDDANNANADIPQGQRSQPTRHDLSSADGKYVSLFYIFFKHLSDSLDSIDSLICTRLVTHILNLTFAGQDFFTIIIEPIILAVQSQIIIYWV